MAEVLLGIIVNLFSISVWPQSKGIHKPRSELLAELAPASRRLHLLHLHPAEAEADGASLPARAQAELASTPRRHLPVDQTGGKESRVRCSLHYRNMYSCTCAAKPIRAHESLLIESVKFSTCSLMFLL
jgi:hypothetical protein